MTMASGGGATTGGGGTTTGGGTIDTSPGFQFDPFKILCGAVAVIVALLVYIWQDTKSDFKETKDSLKELNIKMARIDARMDYLDKDITGIKVDIKDLSSKMGGIETNLAKTISLAKEDIIKAFRERPK